jgi:hypothetical protein
LAAYNIQEYQNNMREYAKVFPQIWIGKTGKQIKSYGVETQLLAYYLMSCPHATMVGIYYLPTALMVHETGLSLENVSKALQNLIEIDFCSYDDAMEYVWVHNMAFFQVGFSLKPCDHRVKHMNEQYKLLPKLKFLDKFFEKYCKAFYLLTLRSSH